MPSFRCVEELKKSEKVHPGVRLFTNRPSIRAALCGMIGKPGFCQSSGPGLCRSEPHFGASQDSQAAAPATPGFPIMPHSAALPNTGVHFLGCLDLGNLA